jgi:hypothetical protein
MLVWLCILCLYDCVFYTIVILSRESANLQFPKDFSQSIVWNSHFGFMESAYASIIRHVCDAIQYDHLSNHVSYDMVQLILEYCTYRQYECTNSTSVNATEVICSLSGMNCFDLLAIAACAARCDMIASAIWLPYDLINTIAEYCTYDALSVGKSSHRLGSLCDFLSWQRAEAHNWCPICNERINRRNPSCSNHNRPERYRLSVGDFDVW